MLDLVDVFTKDNANEAIKSFVKKDDGVTSDGLKVSDLKEFWDLNGKQAVLEVLSGKYKPSIVKNVEITNDKGKRRTISILGAMDRIISRMIAQELQAFFESKFSERCYAYRNGLGVQDALKKASEFIGKGKSIIVSIDIKDFFDSISQKTLVKKLSSHLSEQLLELMMKYLACRIQDEDGIHNKTTGIIQGNPMSPVLSNVYMRDFDLWMDTRKYSWIRYADNIYLFFETIQDAEKGYLAVCKKLKTDRWNLTVNLKKSGVYSDCSTCLILGYSLAKTQDRVEIRKNVRRPKRVYKNWHPSVVSKVNHEYHLMTDGILNRKDYALLFENEEDKHHIPIEVTDQLNVYSGIQLSSSALETCSRSKIRVTIVDKYGDLLGHFVPSEYSQSGVVTIKQCEIYLDQKKRSEFAKAFEIAGIHNMRMNLRYYNKKQRKTEESVKILSSLIDQIKKETALESMMLIEARARQTYYSAFNKIVSDERFAFEKRTRRPPQDALNAMISFGNVLLYNYILNVIWKTSLDPRIGIIHATTRRSASLNLDFADVFKPVIVDRIIFSLVNCHRIHPIADFVQKDNGVHMSDSGKRTFVETFEETLDRHVIVNDQNLSYRRLIEKQVQDFQSCILSNRRFKPYKYY